MFGLCYWYPAVVHWHRKQEDWLPHLLYLVCSPKSEPHLDQAGGTPQPNKHSLHGKHYIYIHYIYIHIILPIKIVTSTISGVVLFHYLYTHTQNQPNAKFWQSYFIMIFNCFTQNKKYFWHFSGPLKPHWLWTRATHQCKIIKSTIYTAYKLDQPFNYLI